MPLSGLPEAAVPLCIALQQAAGLASVLEEVVGHAADGAHILVAGGSPDVAQQQAEVVPARVSLCCGAGRCFAEGQVPVAAQALACPKQQASQPMLHSRCLHHTWSGTGGQLQVRLQMLRLWRWQVHCMRQMTVAKQAHAEANSAARAACIAIKCSTQKACTSHREGQARSWQIGCKCSGRCTGMPCCRRPHLSPSLGVAKTMRPSCGLWSRWRGCHRLFSHL